MLPYCERYDFVFYSLSPLIYQTLSVFKSNTRLLYDEEWENMQNYHDNQLPYQNI